MTCQEALYALEVRDDTLSSQEKAQLDRDGFLPLTDIITHAQAARMRAVMEDLFRLEQTGQEGHAGECEQMQNKSDVYDICITHPRVLAAVAHVLREEFLSFGVHSRPNPPGKGHQALHVDYGGPAPDPGEYFTCNSMWPLTDFTDENGATRAVPGSHRWKQNPASALQDCTIRHPDEILFIAPVGTVIIFNSHVWHGATLNRSTQDRPNVTSFWGRRRTHDGQTRTNPLSRAAFDRLSEPVRCLFDPPDG